MGWGRGQGLTAGQPRNTAKAVAPGSTFLVEIPLLPGWMQERLRFALPSLVGRKAPRGTLVTREENESPLVRTPHNGRAARRFCQLVRFCPGGGGGGGRAVASTAAGSLAPWKGLSHADPFPLAAPGTTLFWCREVGGASERVLLRRDRGPRRATRVRVSLPELRAKAPEPGISAESSRFSAALHPGPAPVSSKHRAACEPFGADEGSIPVYLVCVSLSLSP